MFEHFNTAEELFSYKLASAMAMEHDSLEMLGDLENAALRSDLKEIFREHAHETRQQIENLEACFASMGLETRQEPSPSMKGLAKETKSFMAKTDEALSDAVILAGALETEHHETAVYETLIAQAKALDATQAIQLLSQNLLQEKSAIEKLKAATEAIARANAELPDEPTRIAEQNLHSPPYLPPGSI